MYQNIFIRKSLDKIFVRYVYVCMIFFIYIYRCIYVYDMVRYVCRWSLCLSLDMFFCFNIHIVKKKILSFMLF